LDEKAVPFLLFFYQKKTDGELGFLFFTWFSDTKGAFVKYFLQIFAFKIYLVNWFQNFEF
jgi:hypothetical protein